MPLVTSSKMPGYPWLFRRESLLCLCPMNRVVLATGRKHGLQELKPKKPFIRQSCPLCREITIPTNIRACVKDDTPHLCRDYQKMIDEFSEPKEGAKALAFDTVYAKPLYRQYTINFWRFMITYWRTVEYNAVRYLLTAVIGLAFG